MKQIQIHGGIHGRSIAAFERVSDPAAMSSHFAEEFTGEPRCNLETPSADRLVLRDILARFEKSIIVAALLAADGNQRRAAIALGVLPTTLQEKLKRFGLLDTRFGRRARPGRERHQSDIPKPRHEATHPKSEKQQ